MGAPARDRVTAASSPGSQSRAATTPTTAAATLEGCTAAVGQSGRSATFSAQMSAVLDAERMAIRIELEERSHRAEGFRVITAAGLGVWRSSEPGVKIYRYIKQVTNLAAPAAYRALVHFRWMDAKGRVVKLVTLRTRVCRQPAMPSPASAPGSETTNTTSTSTSTGSAPA